jgi:hypothetical protein
LLEMRKQDVDLYLNSLSREGAKSALKSFKRYARFLWDSARSNPDALNNLHTFLRACLKIPSRAGSARASQASNHQMGHRSIDQGFTGLG